MNSLRTSFKKTGQILPNTLIKYQAAHLHKSFRPTMYNLRHYFSNLRRNDHGYGKWDMIYGPDGFEKVCSFILIFKTQTDRNPNNYKFKSNLIHHTVYELRHLYGDLLYQIFRRWDRLCDPFQKYVLPSSLISLYLLSHQHLAFLVSFLY